MTPKERCDAWNLVYSPGMVVLLRTHKRTVRVTTRGVAHLMEGDLPVISFEGLQQRYALSRVDPI